MDERERLGWFLGIDVSKETFDGCCINSQGEKLFGLSTSMDRKGFEELISQLSSLSVSQVLAPAERNRKRRSGSSDFCAADRRRR